MGRHAAPEGSFYASLLRKPLVIAALLGIVIGVVAGALWWAGQGGTPPTAPEASPVGTGAGAGVEVPAPDPSPVPMPTAG